jgi:hypothetical protein
MGIVSISLLANNGVLQDTTTFTFELFVSKEFSYFIFHCVGQKLYPTVEAKPKRDSLALFFVRKRGSP